MICSKKSSTPNTLKACGRTAAFALTAINFLFVGPANAEKSAAKWSLFSIDELAADSAAGDFLVRDSMSARIISNANAGETLLSAADSYYFVVSGSALLQIGGETISVRRDDVAVAPAGVKHSFVSADDAFKAVDVRPATSVGSAETGVEIVRLADVRKNIDPEKNDWLLFFRRESANYGLYALPEKLGGDKTLTHKIDEINIVIKGEAKFRMDDDEIGVGPGSIMWVRRGVGHYFHTLSKDFETLILFSKWTEPETAPSPQ